MLDPAGRALMLMGRMVQDGNRAIFVTSMRVTGAGPDNQTLAQRGAKAGDFVFAVVADASFVVSLTGGGTWSGASRYRYIQLTAAMLSSEVGCVDGDGFYMEVTYGIVRGINAIATVVSDSGTGASRTRAGFTKSGAHAGLIAVLTHDDGSTGGVTAPSSFSTRSHPSSSTVLQDRLAASAPDYASGTSFTWAAGTSGAHTLTILELRY